MVAPANGQEPPQEEEEPDFGMERFCCFVCHTEGRRVPGTVMVPEEAGYSMGPDNEVDSLQYILHCHDCAMEARSTKFFMLPILTLEDLEVIYSMQERTGQVWEDNQR